MGHHTTTVCSGAMGGTTVWSLLSTRLDATSKNIPVWIILQIALRLLFT